MALDDPGFHATVLTLWRNRLRASARPQRIFDAVRAVVDDNPSLLWDVTLILTRRLRATDEALADAMFLDVTGRTAKRLLQIAGSDNEFSLPVTQEELAAMVGASRERVNKAIATFVRLGWLQVSARTRYRILDRTELEARTHV